MKTIALAGTFDTKEMELLYVKKLCEELGLRTLTINMGTFDSAYSADISSADIARAAGYDLQGIAARRDRALATKALSEGMRIVMPKLYENGNFDGFLSLGGSGGTALATSAMQTLPIGVPKLMVSTMASGNVSQYVGTSDIIMMPAIVDVSGLNRISKMIFRNAALAMAGMVGLKTKLAPDVEGQKPLVAATMFGVTTPCVTAAKEYLEKSGYEVLVFHCTGTGGKTMEMLIDAGFFEGVLDLTTTEWCDEVAGGVLSAGPCRLEAAVRNKVPQVVSVGALDMVNFGPIDTIPRQYAKRNLYEHNPSVTLMRTSVQENIQIAKRLAEKWNHAERDMVLMLPRKGVSMIDARNQPFFGPEEDAALFRTLKSDITNEKIKIIELDTNINDKAFAEEAAKQLISLMT